MFLMPSTAMACGNSNSKHSCEKEVSSKKTEKKCYCSNDSSESKDENGCKGDCGHANCGCSMTCPSSSIEKVKFSYTAPSISDGFHSIWLIPKIG